MTKKQLRRGISWPLLAACLTAPFTVDCGAMSQLPGLAGVTNLVTGCPDVTKVEEIDKFDFASKFQIAPAVAAKVRAGASAALEMQSLAKRIDGELLEGCGGLAKDLGDSTAWSSGESACKGALAALGAAKSKLGPSVALQVDVDPPRCAADAHAYADCAGRCDLSVRGAAADIQCDGALQGRCNAQCRGACQLPPGVRCGGQCSGGCDGHFSGRCEAACTGTCDGQAIDPGAPAACAGICEGTCSGRGSGHCDGRCAGGCKVEGSSCDGECTGECSTAMETPKCLGTFKVPNLSASCKAKCDARVEAEVRCNPGRVVVTLTGAADPQMAANLQSAIERNLPRVLEVGKGMAANVTQVANDIRVIAEGGVSVVTSSGANPALKTALTACIAPTYASAVAAADMAKADVHASVEVTGAFSL